MDKWLSLLALVMHRSKGVIANRLKVDALRRRSSAGGQAAPIVVLQFFDGESIIVAVVNDGGATHPAWYLNLTSTPEA